jgi:hypothetical protein
VRDSVSALAMLDTAVLRAGLVQLEEDLRSGAWSERNRALFERDVCDWGDRLVTGTGQASRTRSIAPE